MSESGGQSAGGLTCPLTQSPGSPPGFAEWRVVYGIGGDTPMETYIARHSGAEMVRAEVDGRLKRFNSGIWGRLPAGLGILIFMSLIQREKGGAFGGNPSYTVVCGCSEDVQGRGGYP